MKLPATMGQAKAEIKRVMENLVIHEVMLKEWRRRGDPIACNDLIAVQEQLILAAKAKIEDIKMRQCNAPAAIKDEEKSLKFLKNYLKVLTNMKLIERLQNVENQLAKIKQEKIEVETPA